MALSLGVLSSFVPCNSISFFNNSLNQVKFGVPAATASNQLRRVSVVLAATSKPAATETKTREPRGIMKPRPVSPEMQAFLGGVAEIPRTQVLKQIWAHIKLHNLQDPTDKKVIICDEKLKTIFAGRERVGFLEIAGLISPHFPKLK